MFTQAAYFTPLSGLPPSTDIAAVAQRLFPQVFRTNFDAPGVALLSLGREINSVALRSFMVALKEGLGEVYYRVTGRHLVYLSMGRFNQQATTKFHLDGVPDESYLMLGYEPTVVQSRLSIADYSRAAYDWGIEPKVLLSDYNPMFPGHEQLLFPYVTALEGFDPTAYQILLLNNGSLPYLPEKGNPLGVMHQATVLNPLPLESRVVNSTMLGTAVEQALEPVNKETQLRFIETQAVAGEIVKVS